MFVMMPIVFILAALPRTETRALSEAPIGAASRVWITGASNIRHFTCTAHEVGGVLALHGRQTDQPVLSGENTSARPSLTVSVGQLDCGIGIMNRHLRDALHAAQHPRIEFRLAAYQVDLRADPVVAQLTGRVVIAGVERPLMTTAEVRADSLGLMHVVGRYVVHLSDFGVTPPRRFGGLLRVRDRATVHFDIVVEPDGGVIDHIRCGTHHHTDSDPLTRPNHALHS